MPDAYPLHAAAESGETDTLNRLLADGAVIDCRDDKDRTPLVLAARAGMAAASHHLIKRGADVNAVTKAGTTVLMFAARAGSAEILRLLLANGAVMDRTVTVVSSSQTEFIAALKWDAEQKIRQGIIGINNEITKYLQSKRIEPGEIARSLKTVPDEMPATESREVQTGHGLLMRAVISGNTELVRVLLDAGLSLNTSEGSSPVAMANILGHLEIARLLLERGADVHGESDWLTNLHRAIIRGNVEACRMLLDFGADLESGSVSPLAIASSLGKTEIVKFLLARGASPFGKPADAGSRNVPPTLFAYSKPQIKQILLEAQGTDWHEAVRQGDLVGVRVRLTNGAQVNVRDDYGTPALVHAAKLKTDAVDMVRLLLNHGADPDAADHSGFTALHTAAGRGDLEVVAVLLARGASVSPINHVGQTPLFAAAHARKRETFDFLQLSGATASISEAVLIGDKKRMYRFLDSGTPIDFPNEAGWTALIAAAHRLDTELCRELLNRGADVNAADVMGQTVLSKAAAALKDNTVDPMPILGLLISRGANVNAADKHGPVALRFAVMRGSVAAARFLLENGADANSSTIGGSILSSVLFEFLLGSRDLLMIRLLLDFGADVNYKGISGSSILDSVLQNPKSMERDPNGERLTALVKLLLNYGADPEKKSTLGKPIDLAAKLGILEVVRLLLDSGADPNGGRGRLSSPLSTAESLGYRDVADLLKECGAAEADDFGFPGLLKQIRSRTQSGGEIDLSTLSNESPPKTEPA